MSQALEKVDELPGVHARISPTKLCKAKAVVSKIALVALAISVSAYFVKRPFGVTVPIGRALEDTSADLCPQVDELIPEKNGVIWESLQDTYSTEEFEARAVDWLGGAVRIPTETFDDMGDVTEPAWEKFLPLHNYLKESFPLLHLNLELTIVNTYGLLYVWKGSDSTLKPLLLTAHQDVVPVLNTTIDEWQHPPFSGYFDGEKIWGRGSCDDKSGLIGIMSAIEVMLEGGFKPTRTVVIASGFDEEVSGMRGASSLATTMLERFGENGFTMLVDEGSGYGESYGRVIAVPAIGEKGSLNVRVKVTSPGGHSSLPPPHTSIGMLAELLVQYEKHPFEVHLTRGSPTYKSAQCMAQHAPGVSPSLKKHLLLAEHCDKALRAAEQELFMNRAFMSLVGTTQAIDIVEGGVKVNALPEQAWAIVNHRISTESSVSATKVRDIELLESLANNFNLSYTAFGAHISDVDAPSYGTLTLSDAFQGGLEPAPVTPSGTDAAPFQLLSGTIKATYNSHRNILGSDAIIVSPGIMSGNTDTRFYWKLTDHIFRYGHQEGAGGGSLPSGVHTVNEAISANNFVEIIRFFTTLILNVDESSLP
ncbi:carboxypeptidase S [Rhizopogon vinicolor AM-OR11-026]|uniref:Carboxypeptidase S n=1 Tax=Rhizopogon vinicolor AM-OR11-026 TaxID=1314800 RepID=A0A1B7NG97_9AGAM|nr:carboxypeptidase S [Rhizopogon vinicolor AM-OR11-026]